jgi:hypothetical protein
VAKYIRPQPAVSAVPQVPAPAARPGLPAIPYSLITTGPYGGAVYSTSTTLITADGAIIPAYIPAYSTGRPVPAGKGRG